MSLLIKVCFISPLGHGLYRPDCGVPFGGAEVQFFLLSREIAKHDDRLVTVLTTVGQELGEGTERQGRVTVVRRKGKQRLNPAHGGGLMKRARGYAGAFSDMYRQLRAINADVYLHAGAGAEVGAYALICRLLGKRFIFVVASSADLGWPNNGSDGPLPRLYRLGLRLAHVVVCRTADQQDALRRLYRRDAMLIRTGHPSRAEDMADAQPAQGRHILWAGRLHPLKQPEMFLDLAERLPQERFAMVVMKDARHPDLMSRLRRRAAALPQVSLHEDVPLEQMDRFMAQAKLFVNTSTYEGFPNTFVQAAMHAVPILSWKVNPDEVLTKQGIGACAEGSFEQLTAALSGYCRDEGLRRATGAQARRYAAGHHDLGRIAELWNDLLWQSVHGRRSAAGPAGVR